VSRQQEYKISELESEVKTLKKLLANAMGSLSIYRLTDSSRPNLKGIKLPGHIVHQAGFQSLEEKHEDIEKMNKLLKQLD